MKDKLKSQIINILLSVKFKILSSFLLIYSTNIVFIIFTWHDLSNIRNYILTSVSLSSFVESGNVILSEINILENALDEYSNPLDVKTEERIKKSVINIESNFRINYYPLFRILFPGNPSTLKQELNHISSSVPQFFRLNKNYPQYSTVVNKSVTSIYLSLSNIRNSVMTLQTKSSEQYAKLQQKKSDSIYYISIKLIVFLILNSFLSLISILYIRKIILNPISTLALSTKNIIRGEFKPIPEIRNRDEIGQLFKDFREMTQTIRNLLESLKGRIDISEQISKELSEREAYLQITINSISDGIISTDEFGRIVNINKAAEAILDKKSCACKDGFLESLFALSNDESDRNKNNILESMLTGDKLLRYYVLSPNSNSKIISASASPIHIKDNILSGFVIIFRDISEQLLIEDKLRHSQKLDLIGQLAGGVAHDFNNMIGGIIGSAEIIRDPDISADEKNEYINIIISAGKKASMLTQKLLAFSRKSKTAKSSLDVKKSVSESILLLQRSIDKKIEVSAVFSDEDIIISADKAQLESAILNLGLNARDAIAGTGNIFFSVSLVYLDSKFCLSSSFDAKPGYYAKISCADNGKGMSNAVKSHLFEPFFTTKEPGKGTGLGLAAVYGTIKEHNGIISVNSTENQGSEFILFLPAGRLEFHDTIYSGEKTMISPKTILLAEDEEILHKVAKKILEDAGHKVLSSFNGEEALTVFHNSEVIIDLFFLDMVMPIKGGKDVFTEIKKQLPDAKIIISSGFAKDADIESMLSQYPETGFIQKPYRRSELTDAVSKMFSE